MSDDNAYPKLEVHANGINATASLKHRDAQTASEDNTDASSLVAAAAAAPVEYTAPSAAVPEALVAATSIALADHRVSAPTSSSSSAGGPAISTRNAAAARDAGYLNSSIVRYSNERRFGENLVDQYARELIRPVPSSSLFSKYTPSSFNPNQLTTNLSHNHNHSSNPHDIIQSYLDSEVAQSIIKSSEPLHHLSGREVILFSFFLISARTLARSILCGFKFGFILHPDPNVTESFKKDTKI